MSWEKQTKEKIDRLYRIRAMEPGCVPISEMSWLLDELQARLEWEKYTNKTLDTVLSDQPEAVRKALGCDESEP